MDDDLVQAKLDDIRALIDRPTTTLPGNATIFDYQRVNRSLQLDYQTLQQRSKISRAGGKFSIMNELWLTDVVFETPRLMDIDPMQPTRYESDYAKNLAATAELYDSLPPSLQVVLADDKQRPWFVRTFLKQHVQERYNAISRLRECASRVLPYNAGHFTPDSNNKDIPGIHGLITDPVSGECDEFPPLLFSDYGNEDTLFRGEILPKMLRGLLLGKSSLDHQRPAKKTGKVGIWGLNGVTAGAIAGVATMTVFVLSPDNEFVREGNVTKLKYFELFDAYKLAILSLPSNIRKNLFAWWDTIVFGAPAVHLESEYTDCSPPQPLDRVRALIARMSLLDTVENVSEESQGRQPVDDSNGEDSNTAIASVAQRSPTPVPGYSTSSFATSSLPSSVSTTPISVLAPIPVLAPTPVLVPTPVLAPTPALAPTSALAPTTSARRVTTCDRSATRGSAGKAGAVRASGASTGEGAAEPVAVVGGKRRSARKK
ncbi:hypothetical protein OF83DRAFT_1169424 [Amylostereum chailletii]|nr:hypothetical protein OF83DRAFT_1169424 [Amylostereum chailletii]